MSQKVDMEALESLFREWEADRLEGATWPLESFPWWNIGDKLKIAAVNALPALLAEVRAARQAQEAWCEVRWEIVKMTAGNPDAVKWFRPHIAVLDTALASPSVPPVAAQAPAQETAALKEGVGMEICEHRINGDCRRPATRNGLCGICHAWVYVDDARGPCPCSASASGQPTAGPPKAPALPKEEVAPVTEREIAFRRKAQERAAIAHNPKPVKVDTRPRCKAITRRHHTCLQAAYTVDGLCGSHATSMWNRYAKQKAAPVPLPEEQLPKKGAAAAPSHVCSHCGGPGDCDPANEGCRTAAMRPAAPAFNDRLRKAGLGGHVAGKLSEEDYPDAAAPAPGDADMRAARLLLGTGCVHEPDPATKAECVKCIAAELARVRSEERERGAGLIDSFVSGLLLEARQTRTLAVQIEQRRIAERLAALAALIEKPRARASDATSAGGGE